MMLEHPSAMEVSGINIGARVKNENMAIRVRTLLDPLEPLSRIPGSPSRWFRKNVVAIGRPACAEFADVI